MYDTEDSNEWEEKELAYRLQEEKYKNIMNSLKQRKKYRQTVIISNATKLLRDNSYEESKSSKE